MKNMLFPVACVSGGLLALSVLAASSDDSKLDPKKPLQPPVETRAADGKADVVKKPAEPIANSKTPAVAKRAGPYSCDVHIDNRTDWYINRVYIDGNLYGAVGRYGDGYVRDIGVGATVAYAELDFTDGSTRSYGPVTFNCNSYATFTWHLR